MVFGARAKFSERNRAVPILKWIENNGEKLIETLKRLGLIWTGRRIMHVS